MPVLLRRNTVGDQIARHRDPSLIAETIEDALRRAEMIDIDVCAFVEESDRAHRLRAAGTVSGGALSGVLVGIKDIINVDGLATRAGSSLDPSLLRGPQAPCITALRGAGALIFGKTETTQFAFADPSPTRNPHSLAHTPGGSSSGSAAAVAAGILPLAIGTQSVDSITNPAAYCGVVGFKPTWGRISLDGVLPLAPPVDHVGVITQDVAGSHIAARLLCAEWKEGAEPKRLVLGVPTGPYLEQVGGAGAREFVTALSALRAAGAEIREVDALGDIDLIGRAHRRLIAASFASVHRSWQVDHPDAYLPLATALIAEGEAAGGLAIEEGIASVRSQREILGDAMAAADIDAWLAPSATGPAPLGLDFIGDPAMSVPWTHAGMPTITVPSGTAPVEPEGVDMPVGVQLVGRFGDDERVLVVATRVEAMLAAG